jgi:hypothetical protein
MPRAMIILVVVLSAAGAVPLFADDYEKFSFKAGAGISTPLNPTGAYAGVSGNVVFGAGYNINKNNAVVGEFMWSGLPSNLFVIQPVKAPFSKINLFTLTVNYRRQFDRLKGSPFGVYLIGGGGWYYRYVSIDKNYVVPAGTVCQPAYYWWGYGCDPSGYVHTQTVASKGSSTGGLNAGTGFTIRFSDSNWRFFTEARYHYGFTERIPTTLVPVTIGMRYN